MDRNLPEPRIDLPDEIRNALDAVAPRLPCFVLDNNKRPVQVSFAEFYERATGPSERVALDVLGDFTISTVFLSTAAMPKEGNPKLFETMVSGPDEGPSGSQWRCATHDEALERHLEACTSVSEWLGTRPTSGR